MYTLEKCYGFRLLVYLHMLTAMNALGEGYGLILLVYLRLFMP